MGVDSRGYEGSRKCTLKEVNRYLIDILILLLFGKEAIAENQLLAHKCWR